MCLDVCTYIELETCKKIGVFEDNTWYRTSIRNCTVKSNIRFIQEVFPYCVAYQRCMKYKIKKRKIYLMLPIRCSNCYFATVQRY